MQTNRIFNRLTRLNRVFVNEKLKESGLSSGLYPFIIELAEKDGISLHELSSAVCVDSSYTTRALDKLIKLKYVEKKTNQADLRSLEIYLTDKGKKVSEKIKAILAEWADIVTSTLTTEEVESYRMIIDKVHAKAMDYFNSKNKKYATNRA